MVFFRLSSKFPPFVLFVCFNIFLYNIEVGDKVSDGGCDGSTSCFGGGPFGGVRESSCNRGKSEGDTKATPEDLTAAGKNLCHKSNIYRSHEIIINYYWSLSIIDHSLQGGAPGR